MIRTVTEIKDLRINYKAREWCKLPYPDHPRGCPNFGKKVTCPEQAPLIEDFINLNKPKIILAVEFNLSEYVEKMRTKHPYWSDRQLRCLLYWQGSVNKELRLLISAVIGLNKLLKITTCPEAMGINVIETARRIGILVELKPRTKVFKIAIGGYE